MNPLLLPVSTSFSRPLLLPRPPEPSSKSPYSSAGGSDGASDGVRPLARRSSPPAEPRRDPAAGGAAAPFFIEARAFGAGPRPPSGPSAPELLWVAAPFALFDALAAGASFAGAFPPLSAEAPLAAGLAVFATAVLAVSCSSRYARSKKLLGLRRHPVSLHLAARRSAPRTMREAGPRAKKHEAYARS
jgi:hypothetical protein